MKHAKNSPSLHTHASVSVAMTMIKNSSADKFSTQFLFFIFCFLICQFFQLWTIVPSHKYNDGLICGFIVKRWLVFVRSLTPPARFTQPRSNPSSNTNLGAFFLPLTQQHYSSEVWGWGETERDDSFLLKWSIPRGVEGLLCSLMVSSFDISSHCVISLRLQSVI